MTHSSQAGLASIRGGIGHMEGAPGFANRERMAREAWSSYSSGGDMSDDFRAGYHRAIIDAFEVSS